MVGRGEVALDVEVAFDIAVPVKLGAVVEGNGLARDAALPDRVCDRARGEDLVAGGHFLDDGQAADPLDQRDQAMRRAAAHDRIAFPVAQLPALLDSDRTLGDVWLAQQHAAGWPAAIAFASDLGHDASVAIQRSTTPFVVAQASIDRFVARNGKRLGAKVADDLVWAPAQLQRRLDPTMHLIVEARPTPTTPASGFCITMRLARSVAPIVACGVALQLATDRARRAIQQSGDRALARTGHAVCRNEISFFLGELVIRHGCNPFLPDEVAASITAHPPVA